MEFTGGYMGQILRIDLSNQKTTIEPLHFKETSALLGGRGVGAKIYYDEIDPGTDPLSPDNKIIFMTGPLTGTRLPCSTKFQLTTKSPVTGIYLCSNSSGNFGPYLKKAGFDGVIIEGKARNWTYITINDADVAFHDARHLSGLTTFETQDALTGSMGTAPAAALSIGPAGEKNIRLACISVDGRFFGRGGAGAVMGSKLLRGIAVHGYGTVPVADSRTVKELLPEAARILKDSRASLTESGTAMYVEPINELGCLPTRNFRTSFFEGAGKIDARAMKENYWEKNTACYMCPVACGKMSIVTDGQFAGSKAKTEYETIVMLGANCGIDDFGAVVKAAQVCDETGIDTMSVGSAVALTMELFEKGLITSKDTDGKKVRFGDPQALMHVIHLIVAKRGIGQLLSEGMKIVMNKRPEYSPYILAVKGLTFAAYDPRGVSGKALTFGTSNRGACHNVGGWTIKEELLSGEYNRFSPEGKGELVTSIQNTRAYVDCLGICTVARKSMGFTDKPAGRVLEAVTGYPFTHHLLEIGGRVYNLERVILNREGIRRKDDQMPFRIMNDPVETGPCKGRLLPSDVYNTMLDEYYAARGWNEDGVVTDETIDAFGLREFLYG